MPFYFGYGVDSAYLAVVLVALVLGTAAQGYIRSTYRKWSQVDAGIPGTGAEVARVMLADGGASGVGIARVGGSLTDHRGASVASLAVACHEAGHAIQAAQGFFPYRVRTMLVPAVGIAENSWILVLLAGVLLNLGGLVQLAIVLFAVAVVFQLVTLPVEIDASRRAVAFLSSRGSGLDEKGARAVLTAAALTYVAAALTSIMQLVYLLGRYGNRGND